MFIGCSVLAAMDTKQSNEGSEALQRKRRRGEEADLGSLQGLGESSIPIEGVELLDSHEVERDFGRTQDAFDKFEVPYEGMNPAIQLQMGDVAPECVDSEDSSRYSNKILQGVHIIESSSQLRGDTEALCMDVEQLFHEQPHRSTEDLRAEPLEIDVEKIELTEMDRYLSAELEFMQERSAHTRGLRRHLLELKRILDKVQKNFEAENHGSSFECHQRYESIVPILCRVVTSEVHPEGEDFSTTRTLISAIKVCRAFLGYGGLLCEELGKLMGCQSWADATFQFLESLASSDCDHFFSEQVSSLMCMLLGIIGKCDDEHILVGASRTAAELFRHNIFQMSILNTPEILHQLADLLGKARCRHIAATLIANLLCEDGGSEPPRLFVGDSKFLRDVSSLNRQRLLRMKAEIMRSPLLVEPFFRHILEFGNGDLHLAVLKVIEEMCDSHRFYSFIRRPAIFMVLRWFVLRAKRRTSRTKLEGPGHAEDVRRYARGTYAALQSWQWLNIDGDAEEYCSKTMRAYLVQFFGDDRGHRLIAATSVFSRLARAAITLTVNIVAYFLNMLDNNVQASLAKNHVPQLQVGVAGVLCLHLDGARGQGKISFMADTVGKTGSLPQAPQRVAKLLSQADQDEVRQVVATGRANLTKADLKSIGLSWGFPDVAKNLIATAGGDKANNFPSCGSCRSLNGFDAQRTLWSTQYIVA